VVLVYDGACGFCRRTVRWARAVGGRFDAVPSSDVDPGPLGLTRADLDAAAWWVERDGTLLRGHDAVARTLRTSRWLPVRLLGRLVGSRAAAPGARRAYAWVAAHRSRFPAWLG
jgi:predicted DCC family thiol-disulfide oxidoreductase YuxK